MKYHYEFNDIKDVDDIYYSISLPTLSNGKWINGIQYYLVQKTSIQIFINDILLDKHLILPEDRFMHNQLCNYHNKTPETETFLIKLLIGKIDVIFDYLVYFSHPEYKVIVDVDIITDFDTYKEKIVIGNNPTIDGSFIVNEFIYGQYSDYDIYDEIETIKIVI